jgi:hypothetical protein
MPCSPKTERGREQQCGLAHGRRADLTSLDRAPSCAISALSRTNRTRGHELNNSNNTVPVRFLIATGVAEGSGFAAPSLAGRLARRHP